MTRKWCVSSAWWVAGNSLAIDHLPHPMHRWASTRASPRSVLISKSQFRLSPASTSSRSRRSSLPPTPGTFSPAHFLHPHRVPRYLCSMRIRSIRNHTPYLNFQTAAESSQLSSTSLYTNRYCSKCQEHREALKKFDVWKLVRTPHTSIAGLTIKCSFLRILSQPQILVVHLKRFQFSRTWREKIETLVGANLTTWLPCRTSMHVHLPSMP